jgi:hypothetical protein
MVFCACVFMLDMEGLRGVFKVESAEGLERRSFAESLWGSMKRLYSARQTGPIYLGRTLVQILQVRRGYNG